MFDAIANPKRSVRSARSIALSTPCTAPFWARPCSSPGCKRTSSRRGSSRFRCHPTALEGEIEGTLVVKCVVTTQGTVRNCRVLKSLPFMDRAVTDALEKRRYTPALLRGQVIEIDYTFSVQLKLPQ